MGTYFFILSRSPGGYTHVILNSRHCLQDGVSPLHFVFRSRHDLHARGTRLPCLGEAADRCRGIATFAVLAPAEDTGTEVVGVSINDVLLAFGMWEALAVAETAFWDHGPGQLSSPIMSSGG